MSPTYAETVSFPVGIGNIEDPESALIYCSRLVAARFLLSGQNGDIIPDKDVRVSHKCLALSSLVTILSLRPDLLSLSLFKSGSHVFIETWKGKKI